ncbi:MAG: hypothetical protein IKF14_00255 [Atopobiaceae bacterium]|nr:hypothetical protein [Atopobiaceae bacterium]
MPNTKRKLRALLASAMLVCMLTLAACGGNATSSASSSANTTDASSSAAAASSQAQQTEPFGKPWLVSIVEGNIPEAAPDAKDDLFLSLTYDSIAEHQGETWLNAAAHSDELKAKTIDAIGQKDASDPEAAQFRILHDQAADWDTLAKTGLSEVQPYLDRIDAATSIDELNAVLTAEDFPFSPFLTAVLGVTDTRENTNVSVYPNFLYFDMLSEGGRYYAGADTDEGNTLLMSMVMTPKMELTTDFMQLGMSEDEGIEACDKLLEFEKAYGKDADYTAKYVKADFGAYANSLNEFVFTLDELCAACPNIPLREMLAKMGKDGAEKYRAASSQWLSSLSDAWTDENLETIKLLAKAKVLEETRPYRDPTAYNNYVSTMGIPAKETDAFAWDACDNSNTFAQFICKTYVNDVLGENAKTRLTKVTEDTVADYRELFAATPWLSEESRAKVIEKLDNLAINILEPSAGWFDYSSLELKSTEEGGTLLSNYLLCKQYRYDREAELIGQPAIRCAAWYYVNPSTPNAFYDAEGNSINLIPGFVNSMNYSDEMSDSAVLGAIGWTLGHELSHGYDFLGAQSDAYGMGTPVFSDADQQAFLGKCAEIADYFSTIELESGEMYDGQHVVAEAAADLCGMQVMLDLMGKMDSPDYEGFYAKGAELYAETVPPLVYPQLKTDGHPLHYLRVNVNAQMFEPFYETYGVTEGDGMYLAPDKRITIWGKNA